MYIITSSKAHFFSFSFKEHPFQQLEIESPVFSSLERFTVVIYDKSNATAHVNKARRDLFTKHNRALENIPPTQVSTIYPFHLLIFRRFIQNYSSHFRPHCFNIREELFIKQVYGQVPRPNSMCHHQTPLGGKRLAKTVRGSHCGLLCLKQLKLAASYSSVHAKKDALGDVNASKQPYSAQNFAPVLQDATIRQHEL